MLIFCLTLIILILSFALSYVLFGRKKADSDYLDKVPLSYLIINGNKILYASNMLKLFGINKLSMSKFCNIIPKQHWNSIKEQTKGVSDFSIEGSFEYKDNKIYYLSIYHKVTGNIFLLLTEASFFPEKKEVEILLHKYRGMSYHLYYLLDNIPFPIWMRDEEKVIWSNQSFMQIIKELNIKDGMITRKGAGVKTFLIRDKPQVFDIKEEQSKYDGRFLGYMQNINNSVEIKKKYTSVKAILLKITERMTRGVLVVNSYGKIVYYNPLLLQMFSLEEKWMVQSPSFSSFIDKLREGNYLPEVKDYKSYKQTQMQFLMGHYSEQTFVMHLPNRKEIQVVVIQVESGDTIFIYKDMNQIKDFQSKYKLLLKSNDKILNSVRSPINMYAQDGKLKIMNVHMAKIIGEDTHKLIGKHFEDVLLYFKERKLFGIEKNFKCCREVIIKVLEYGEDVHRLTNNNLKNIDITKLPDGRVMIQHLV